MKKNILLVGAGGGNDIFATLLLSEYIGDNFYDVAGMLSPGASHIINGKPEKIINQLDTNTKRFIHDKEIPFVDNQIKKLVSKYKYNIRNFYHISTLFGTDSIVNELNSLIRKNRYNEVVFLDVGGDITARTTDNDILSPFMDSTCLYLSDKLTVPVSIYIMGFGMDGEMKYNGIKEVLSELDPVISQRIRITNTNMAFYKFAAMNEDISKHRLGYAAHNIIKYVNTVVDVEIPFKTKYIIEDEKYYNEYKSIIPKDTLGMIYKIDNSLVKNRQYIKPYNNVFDNYVYLKQLNPTWKNELDMCVNEDKYMLAVSKSVASREIIINSGLKYSMRINKTPVLFESDSYLNVYEKIVPYYIKDIN